MLARTVKPTKRWLLLLPFACAALPLWFAASVLLDYIRHPVFPLYYTIAQVAVFVWTAFAVGISVLRGFVRPSEPHAARQPAWRDPLLWSGLVVAGTFLLAVHIHSQQRERDLPLRIRLEHALSHPPRI
jgi:hypothetical protein